MEVMEEKRKIVYLLGTLHVSKRSAERVEDTVRTVLPDFVCLELDAARMRALKEENEKVSENREGGQFRYSGHRNHPPLIAMLLKWLQQEIGKEFGVMPGLEMLSGYGAAKKYKLKVALIDRPIGLTINRLLKLMTSREKIKMIGYLGASAGVLVLKPLFGKRIDSIVSLLGEKKEIDISKLEKGEGIEDLMTTLRKEFPTIHKVLVEERNEYMVKNIEHILKTRAGSLVVVVGGGHVPGMEKMLRSLGITVKKV